MSCLMLWTHIWRPYFPQVAFIIGMLEVDHRLMETKTKANRVPTCHMLFFFSLWLTLFAFPGTSSSSRPMSGAAPGHQLLSEAEKAARSCPGLPRCVNVTSPARNASSQLSGAALSSPRSFDALMGRLRISLGLFVKARCAMWEYGATTHGWKQKKFVHYYFCSF